MTLGRRTLIWSLLTCSCWRVRRIGPIGTMSLIRLVHYNGKRLTKRKSYWKANSKTRLTIYCDKKGRSSSKYRRQSKSGRCSQSWKIISRKRFIANKSRKRHHRPNLKTCTSSSTPWSRAALTRHSINLTSHSWKKCSCSMLMIPMSGRTRTRMSKSRSRRRARKRTFWRHLNNKASTKFNNINKIT